MASPHRFLLPLAILLFACTTCAQADWTRCQSPVKDQGRRGTCAAFAICGALETFPGVPGDLSEQLLYASLKLHQNAVVGWMKQAGQDATLREGDLFSAYVGLFDVLGTCAEAFLPYDPDPRKAGPGVPEDLQRFLELAQVTPADLERLRDGYGKHGFAKKDCEVLDQAAVRDVGALKALFDSGVVAIPVGYRVHGTNWSNLKETGNTGADGRRLFVHPGMMDRFRREGGEWMDYNAAKVACMQRGEDLVDGLEKGTWAREPVGPVEEYGGHAVLLVGYEDRGFLAKNSWGTEWGDGGYFRIPWDYHALYAVQGAVIGAARIRNPSLNPFETTARIANGRFRVKVQPRGRGDSAHWLVSTWMLEPRDAAFERVEYTLAAQGADGGWQDFMTRAADAGQPDRRTGAMVAVDGPHLERALGSRAVRITIRVGVRTSTEAGDLDATQWLRTMEMAPFAPELKGAVDLEPAAR